MTLSAVMAGLVVPAIRAFARRCEKDVDARDNRGHDESKAAQLGVIRARQKLSTASAATAPAADIIPFSRSTITAFYSRRLAPMRT
jgi:hypothetical protein